MIVFIVDMEYKQADVPRSKDSSIPSSSKATARFLAETRRDEEKPNGLRRWIRLRGIHSYSVATVFAELPRFCPDYYQVLA